MRTTRRVIIVAAGAISLSVAVAAGAAPFSWADTVTPAWPAAQGMTTGVRLPGAGDASAIGVAGQAGSWGRAIEVPGLGALNKGGNGDLTADITEMSCASAGNCAAVGYYADRHHHRQGFVAVERHGRWGTAIEVPGLAALNTGGTAGSSAAVSSVSCASAGNCAAGGYYTNRHHHTQGFVAVERHGRWGKAIKVPGLGALNKGDAGVSSVSCASAGNCAAGGLYADRRGHLQMFAASQRHGRWGKAIEVPGLGALNTGDASWDASVTEVSCASAGNCAAGGFYTDQAGNTQGFVASERHGRWGKVIEVPGLGALNSGGGAGVFSVSCGAAGSCAAVGDYIDGGGSGQGFVADERHGRWRKAIEVPGLAALGYENADVESVSCASAGNCAAVGYGDPYGDGFAVSEKNGRWGKAIDVAGGGRFAGLNSVSCASPGNCAAGGFYSNDSGDIVQGLVAVERHGRWRDQIDVPGLRALNRGADAAVTSVSCPPAGGCAAGGYYYDRHGHFQVFVVSQTG